MSKLRPLHPAAPAPIVTPEVAASTLEVLRSVHAERKLRERRAWMEVLRRAEAGDLPGVVEIARGRVESGGPKSA